MREKTYVTASEIAEIMQVSKGYAYKLTRELNAELKEKGYVTIAGRLPRAFCEQKIFGFSAEAGKAAEEDVKVEETPAADDVVKDAPATNEDETTTDEDKTATETEDAK